LDFGQSTIRLIGKRGKGKEKGKKKEIKKKGKENYKLIKLG